MKAKLGALEVELELAYPKLSDHDFKAELPGGFALNCYKWGNSQKWTASLDGPWYDDSNPEASGDTPEEAISELSTMVWSWCRQFSELSSAIQ